MMPIALPRCSAGHVSATSAAPVAHSPPMPRPSTRRATAELPDAVCESRRRRLRPSRRVSTPSARRRGPCGRRASRTGRRRRRTPPAEAPAAGRSPGRRCRTSARTRSRTNEVQQHVHRVEHPAERGRDEGSSAAAGRHCRGCGYRDASGAAIVTPAASSSAADSRAESPARLAYRRAGTSCQRGIAMRRPIDGDPRCVSGNRTAPGAQPSQAGRDGARMRCAARAIRQR